MMFYSLYELFVLLFYVLRFFFFFFFFQAEDGIRDHCVTGVQTCALPICGTVVIGEGERDKAPMLYVGEPLGRGWTEGEIYPEIDIAVDPLEGTNLCATGSANSIAVLAAADRKSTRLNSSHTVTSYAVFCL